jgi:hypothetical protein
MHQTVSTIVVLLPETTGTSLVFKKYLDHRLPVGAPA